MGKWLRGGVPAWEEDRSLGLATLGAYSSASVEIGFTRICKVFREKLVSTARPAAQL
jgi:hypothetical protein